MNLSIHLSYTFQWWHLLVFFMWALGAWMLHVLCDRRPTWKDRLFVVTWPVSVPLVLFAMGVENWYVTRWDR